MQDQGRDSHICRCCFLKNSAYEREWVPTSPRRVREARQAVVK